MVDYDWADLIDDEDRVRLLIDPTGPYAQAAAFALGRAMDDAIVDAADSTAYTGVAGGTSTSYDSNMTVDVQVGGGASDTGLNITKLRAAKQNLDANDIDADIPRFCIINAKQLQNLLAETEITSSDYNIVKALTH